MRRSRGVSLVFVVWVVIGVIVAASHHYFSELKTLGSVLSALLAILLWPLIFSAPKSPSTFDRSAGCHRFG
jgi:ABC-type anion transport system duplicated permease subunit